MLRNPSSGDLVSLLAGAEVPEWAEGQVGDHLITKGDESEDGKPNPKWAEGQVGDHLITKGDESEDGKPNPKWTVAQLDAYAAAHGIDLGDASNKVEKLAVLTAGE